MKRTVLLVLAALAALWGVIAGTSGVTVTRDLSESFQCGSAFSPDESPEYSMYWADTMNFEVNNAPSSLEARAVCRDDLGSARTRAITLLGGSLLLLIWGLNSPTPAQVAARRAQDYWASLGYPPHPGGGFGHPIAPAQAWYPAAALPPGQFPVQSQPAGWGQAPGYAANPQQVWHQTHPDQQQQQAHQQVQHQGQHQGYGQPGPYPVQGWQPGA